MKEAPLNHRAIAGTAAAAAAAVVAVTFVALALSLSQARAEVDPFQFQFSALAYKVKESAPVAKLTVVRSGNAAEEASISFSTVDSGGGSAVAGADYLPTNGTLTFGPGVTSLSFYVPIVEDAIHEPNETVVVELGNLNSTTLTITDNDDCAFSLNPPSRSHGFDGGLATVHLTATAGCEWTVTDTVGWIAVLNPSGTGSAEVQYSYDANPSERSRTGTIKIAGRTFTVTQAGVPPPDLTPPTITISTPANRSRQTNAQIQVTGRASDAGGVTNIEVRLENEAGIGEYFSASGTNLWSATISGLIPGMNTIRVRGRDAADNLSAEATVEVNFVEVSQIIVTTAGNGSVSPSLNGKYLDIDATYTLAARADKNHFFSHWSGDVESSANPMTFIMRSNFMVAANFIYSPFFAVAGNYNGLFSEPGLVRHESCGFLTLKLGGLGSYSGSLNLTGKRARLSGRFDLNGQAVNTVTLDETNQLTVTLLLDLNGDTNKLTGTVSNEFWQAQILADRQTFDGRTSIALQAGHYTLVLPGEPANDANQPGGDSFGLVTVDKSGRLRLAATLADGTKASQAVPISKDGSWPLYCPLGRRSGSWFSRVSFTGTVPYEFMGAMHWTRGQQEGAVRYGNGFVVDRIFSGAAYQGPTNNTDRLLSFSDGRVRFRAGNQDFENLVSISADNRVTDLEQNHLSLVITKNTGLFRGSVTVPVTLEKLKFSGVIDRKNDYGAGFFLTPDRSGQVLLEPKQ